MKLSEREKNLITTALFILESQCIGDDLYFGIEDDLGGRPDPDEVRALMEKFKDNL